MDNLEILAKANEQVVGHLKAKKAIINAINRSKRRYIQKFRDMVLLEDYLDTSNVLLIGATGTGKTLLVESISNIMGAHYIKFDASTFNPVANREGLSVETVQKIISEALKNTLTQQSEKYFSTGGIEAQTIVHIDEFDKMCKEYSSGEWKQGTQGEFLSFFENKGEFKDLTFIFSGAFQGLSPKKDKKAQIGFFKHEEEVQESKLDEELVKFGVMPELLGRISNVTLLDELDKEDYEEILNNILLPKVTNNLSTIGALNWTISDKDKSDLIDRAMASGLGVRGLKRELSNIVQEIEFSISL